MKILSRKMSIPYLLGTILAIIINASSGAKIPSSEGSSESHNSKLQKRQAPIGHGVGSSSISSSGLSIGQMQGNFGFQHNNPIPSYANNINTYDHLRSNSLNYPSSTNYNANYPREKDYYPSSSSYGSGRSTGGIGAGTNYYERDYRTGYRQQPYDDYRYNSYQRDAVAAPNQEFMVRHGQMRHEEYQKRTGQGGPEFYDPFYFIGVRNQNQQQNGQLLNQPLSSLSNQQLSLSPAVSTAPVSSTAPILPSSSSTSSSSSSSSPAAPLRNRRNSHQRPNDFYNEINGGKYDIMTAKSAYPAVGPLAHPHHHHHHNHRLAGPHHGGPNQFLTREQLVRNPDSRVPYPSNHLDYYGSSAGGQPWSVRIGTQLKVNDDGRSPNPHRFYVRDEINPTKSRSRYPLYRR